MTEAFTDRSRQETYQVCPRRRYLQYELMGTGIVRVRGTVPLMTGTYVHAGLADVLRQVMALGNVPHAHLRVSVEQAVKVAVDGYRAEVKARGLDVDLGEDAQAVADEQIMLTEGLIRAYVKAPSGLEALLRTYRVLEVEHEDTWSAFTTVPSRPIQWRDTNGNSGTTYPHTGITMQARADALLQELGSNDLYVLSWKTAATQDYRKDNEGRHDVQGLSEVAVVERRLRDWWTDLQGTTRLPGPWMQEHQCSEQVWNMLTDHCDSSPRIMGVQMVYLLKGMRRQAYDGGPYVTHSPLLRGWYRDGVTEREYAWKEETPCPGPGHVLSYGKKGPILCEGKKFHKLGAQWTKFDVGRDGAPSLSEWIDLLASNTMQPELGDALDSLVWTPQPYYRQDRDMADWVQQAQAQEQLVIAAAQDVERHRRDGVDANGLRSLLNISFPQYRRACDWPSACQFINVCYGDDTMLTNPFSTGMYQRRVPHHEAELCAKTELLTIADLSRTKTDG